MKHQIVYHADCMDGYAAMSLLSFYLSLRMPIGDVKKYPMRYDQRDQFIDEFCPDENTVLWVVDFSFTPEQTQMLAPCLHRIVMIDHHDKAIEQWKDITIHPKVELYLDNKVSGLMGVRNYIKDRPLLPKPEREITYQIGLNMLEDLLDCAGIKLLQDYDLHTGLYEETLPFMKYLLAQGFLTNNGPSENLLDVLVKTTDLVITGKSTSSSRPLIVQDPIIEIGRLILNYEEGIVAGLVEKAWQGPVCGHDVPVANIPYIYRDMAGTMLNQQFINAPFSATFADEWDEHRQVRIRRWSLRSAKEKGVDLNDIMSKAGVDGGGHPTAAGFVEIIDTKLMGIQK